MSLLPFWALKVAMMFLFMWGTESSQILSKIS